MFGVQGPDPDRRIAAVTTNLSTSAATSSVRADYRHYDLRSERDEQALAAYLDDRFTGTV
jgi:hypothetical protein